MGIPPLSLSLSLSITLEMGILSFQQHQTSQAHFCLSSFPSQMETPDSPQISKEEHATLQGESLYYFGSSFSPTHSYGGYGGLPSMPSWVNQQLTLIYCGKNPKIHLNHEGDSNKNG
jgi:hypothetical protein